MAYTDIRMTLYLKYRPQNISELDLGSVREMLGKTLASKNLPHAFLFAGPRGTGKTSAARILAKTLNCNEGKTEPCNKCEMCKEITAGTAPDVVEIDAASNRGIDEIRDLREKVRLASMRAQYKIYIIDEVHMLTTEAANALLKTLEEPPEKVVFVLCTTEPEKLPETVVSRCTLIKFVKPSLEEITGKLEVVAKGEDLRITNDELRMIAKSAKGSFRDAIKVLEQVINTGMKAAEVTGVLAAADPGEFLDCVQGGQTKEALEMIKLLADTGVNMRGFIERCVEYLREELLMVVGSQKPGVGVSEIIKMVEGLNRAYEQTKNAAVQQLPLEIFVIENSRNAGPEKNTPAEELPAIKKESKEKKEERTEVKISGMGKYNLGDVEKKWGEIMMAVRPKNHSVEALLRSTRPVEFDGEKLRLEVFYQFHKDKLETDKCRQIVESTVGETFGVSNIKLYLKLGEKKKSRDDNLVGKVDEDIIAAAKEIFKVEAI